MMAVGPGAANPLVSVIVPAFNAEATLDDSIRSALQGHYPNVELIVVDDGSTDDSAAIARRWADEDRRVQLVSQSNRGLSAALNAGVAKASGDYVARLDSDDLWHPDKLVRQVDLAIREPKLALIYCWARYIDEDGRLVHDGPAQRFPEYALCRGLTESIVGGGSSMLVKRSALIEAGGFDEEYRSWEDLLLQLKISARHPIGFVPAYLVGYRIRPGSLSDDPRAMLDIWRRLGERIDAEFPQVPSHVRRWANASRYAMFAESFAWRGDWLSSGRLLAEALSDDPRWTLRLLAHRIVRHFDRRKSTTVEQSPRPDFFDCDPDKPVRPPPAEQGKSGSALQRLEASRAQEMEVLDRDLAAKGGTGDGN